MQFRAKVGGTLAQSASATRLIYMPYLLRMLYLESRSRRARCQDFQRAEVLNQRCAGLLRFDPNAVDPDESIRGGSPVWDGRFLFRNPWFTPSPSIYWKVGVSGKTPKNLRPQQLRGKVFHSKELGGSWTVKELGLAFRIGLCGGEKSRGKRGRRREVWDGIGKESFGAFRRWSK
jgi:hypothetical protein